MACPGIYQIEHVTSGKRYIGSAVDIPVRWGLHRSDLRLGRHHSILLQRSWNKYGERAFRFCVLEECPAENLIEREQFWMDHFESCIPQKGFNINPTAGSALGVKRRSETKQKLSRLKKQFYANGGEPWNKGEPWDEEVREKLRQANLGKTYSDETNLKKGTGWRGKKRGPMPEEQRRKVSASKRGKPLNVSKEQKQEHARKAWKTRRVNGTTGHSEKTKQRFSDIRRSNPTKKPDILIDGKSLPQIAAETGIKYNTLYWRLQNGKALLSNATKPLISESKRSVS